MKRFPSRFSPRPFLGLLALWGAGLCLFAGAAYGDGIKATIDRSTATIQDRLVLTVTIEGARSVTPTLPELPDFIVGTPQQMSQMQFVNGRTSVSVSYRYPLTPRRTGTFTIGSATVEIDGQVYRTDPFRVRIVEASQAPEGSDRDVFVTASVSTDKPYVGQQVIYTWRFYRREQVSEAQLDQQTFDGFLVENLGDAKTYTTTYQGMEYAVHEIKKALFPQEVGTLTVPGSTLNTTVIRRTQRRRSFFDSPFGNTVSEAKVLRSPPIEIEVRPLPAAPPGFSGLVGSFDLRTRISKRELMVGESATFTVTVSGQGNAQMIGQPPFPDLPRFKLYDENPTGGVERGDNGLSGRKTYSKALVPLEAGELTVPGLSLTYFDPDAGSYRTDRTEPIVLAVAPREGDEDLGLTRAIGPNGGKVAVKMLGDDILPLHRGLDALQGPGLGSPRSPALLAGLLLPPLLFLGLFGAMKRQRRFAEDSTLKRRLQALKTAQKDLKEIAAAGLGPQQAAPRVSLCLRRYIGDKLGLEGTALTPAEAAEALRQAGVSEDLVARVHRLLDRLEAAQYGAAQIPAAQLEEEVGGLLKELEKELR